MHLRVDGQLVLRLLLFVSTSRTLRHVFDHSLAHSHHAARPPRIFLDYRDELFPLWLSQEVSEIQGTLRPNISVVCRCGCIIEGSDELFPDTDDLDVAQIVEVPM